jgi:hypothetical protein
LEGIKVMNDKQLFIDILSPSLISIAEEHIKNNLLHNFYEEITNDEEVRRRTYGHENYSTNAVLIEFFFSQETKTPALLRREIIKDLRSFFNIDPSYYGTPLDLEFYRATWQKI